MIIRLTCFALLVSIAASSHAHGGIVSKLARTATKITVKKAAKEVFQSSAKTSAKEAADKATREFAESQAKNLASKSARSSTTTIADAGRIALKQSDEFLAVAGKVTAQNARRLELMSDSIERSGKGKEFLALLATNAAADQIIDFLWRHKGAIAGGTIITAILADPAAAMAAGAEVTTAVIETAGEHIAQPTIEVTAQHVVGPTVASHLGQLGLWLLIALLVSSFVYKRIVSSASVARANRLLRYMRKEQK